MKLGQVTKLVKRNKGTSKKKLTMTSCLRIVRSLHFPIYGQSGAIWKPDSGRIVCKTYISTNSNLWSYKNWKQNEKIFNTAPTLLLWVKVLFWPKNAIFCKKMVTSAKLIGPKPTQIKVKAIIPTIQKHVVMLLIFVSSSKNFVMTSFTIKIKKICCLSH